MLEKTNTAVTDFLSELALIDIIQSVEYILNDAGLKVCIEYRVRLKTRCHRYKKTLLLCMIVYIPIIIIICSLF